MKLAGILILVIVVVMVVLKLRGSSGQTSKSVARKTSAKPRANGAASVQASSRYQSVSINAGPNACEAVLALEGKRFLVGKIAKLPLADCTSATCTCKFVHHDDRRAHEGDKRALSGLSIELYHTSGKPERRERKGRRKDDHG